MKRLRVAMVAVLAAGAMMLPLQADATARALIIHNSVNSEYEYLGITTWTSGTRVVWNLSRGYTANNRAGAASSDARGFNIGPGWCAHFYVMRLDIPGSVGWDYLGTIGPGAHFPTNGPWIYGVEQHPSVYGGVHGCG